jgi:hypothetical protein
LFFLIPISEEIIKGLKKENIPVYGDVTGAVSSLGALYKFKAFIEQNEETAEEADIDTLVKRYGENGFDLKLLSFFKKQILNKDHTIFAASSRILNFKVFWDIVEQNGISIHLQGKPLDIYMQ